MAVTDLQSTDNPTGQDRLRAVMYLYRWCLRHLLHVWCLASTLSQDDGEPVMNATTATAIPSDRDVALADRAGRKLGRVGS